MIEIAALQPDHAAVLNVWPIGTGRANVSSYILIPERADTDKARGYWKANADILYNATDEDFAMGESIQSGLASGANRELVFGKPVQFFAYAARAMRHLLADRARDRLRLRAGGQWMRVTLTGTDDRLAIDSAEQALALDEALKRLEDADERAARVVELRYFAGLTPEQIAEALGVTRRTVDRDWRFARAFLKTEIG